MSVIDGTLQANEAYYRTFTQGLVPPRPARHLAVVTCMDARLDVAGMLGLNPGDAHVLRNAGGIVTEDVLRSLLISHHLLGTREFMIIGHTECGMMTFRDDEARSRIQRATGTAAVTPAAFHSFTDLEENVREQAQKLRSHPWIPREVIIRGFVYDVRTGRLAEVRI